MSHDVYRAPEAPLIRSDAPLEPRSAVVAVLLGCSVDIALSVVFGVSLGLLRFSPEEVAHGPVGFLLNGAVGFLGGWTAARYRRGPWLGVTLAVVAFDLLVSGGAQALDLPGMPDPLAAALLLAVSVTGDVGGGYAGRGWRMPRARER